MSTPTIPPPYAALVAGGCIRFTDSGPAWHVNGTHATHGIDPTTAPKIETNGDLTFTLTSDHSHVIAAIAAPDETIATRGISAGISGGVGPCVVRFYDSTIGRRLNLASAADYDRLAGTYSNLWLAVFGLHTPDLI